jgi:hypothetical protein
MTRKACRTRFNSVIARSIGTAPGVVKTRHVAGAGESGAAKSEVANCAAADGSGSGRAVKNQLAAMAQTAMNVGISHKNGRSFGCAEWPAYHHRGLFSHCALN